MKLELNLAVQVIVPMNGDTLESVQVDQTYRSVIDVSNGLPPGVLLRLRNDLERIIEDTYTEAAKAQSLEQELDTLT